MERPKYPLCVMSLVKGGVHYPKYVTIVNSGGARLLRYREQICMCVNHINFLYFEWGLIL